MLIIFMTITGIIMILIIIMIMTIIITISTIIIVTIVTTLTNADYIQYRVILARWAVLLSEAR